MAGVTRLELATSCVTGDQMLKSGKFNASFYACKQSSNEGPVDISRQLVLSGYQFGYQLLLLTPQLLDRQADHASLGSLKHAYDSVVGISVLPR